MFSPFDDHLHIVQPVVRLKAATLRVAQALVPSVEAIGPLDSRQAVGSIIDSGVIELMKIVSGQKLSDAAEATKCLIDSILTSPYVDSIRQDQYVQLKDWLNKLDMVQEPSQIPILLIINRDFLRGGLAPNDIYNSVESLLDTIPNSLYILLLQGLYVARTGIRSFI